MDAHSAAALFPLLDGPDFSALCADIEAHGQREPIVILDGKILDGRNRDRACRKIGVKPTVVRVKESDIGDPVAYVVSANLARRHLTESQRSMIGLDVKREYARAAEQRMKAGKKPSGPGAVGSNGEAREQAAAAVGVGARSISRAQRVVEDGAKPVADAVRNGHVSVKVAERLVRAVPDKQQQAEIIKAAVKDERPDRIINDAVTPKAAPPQYVVSDQVIDVVERFVVTVEQIYQQYGGPAKLFADKRWDAKQTSYFKQHLFGLQGLLAKLHKDVTDGK